MVYVQREGVAGSCKGVQKVCRTKFRRKIKQKHCVALSCLRSFKGGGSMRKHGKSLTPRVLAALVSEVATVCLMTYLRICRENHQDRAPALMFTGNRVQYRSCMALKHQSARTRCPDHASSGILSAVYPFYTSYRLRGHHITSKGAFTGSHLVHI